MAFPTPLVVALTLLLLIIPLATARLIAILPPRRPHPRRRDTPTHILIILGSGGHTAEMLSILRRSHGGAGQWSAFTTRTWVVSSGDGFSASFARAFEASVGGVERGDGERHAHGYSVVEVPRARRIHQPLYSAPLSCLGCFCACLRLLARGPAYPDLLLCNGPATAAVCVFASVALRFCDWRGAHSRGKMRTVYVESWARVGKLSLSGRLLARVVDRLLVQWEGLDGVAGRGEFRGVLVG